MKYKSFLRLDPVWYYGTSLSTMELILPSEKKNMLQNVDFQGDTVWWLWFCVYLVVNFLSQVIFVFLLFLGVVMYANDVETKEK